MVITINEFKKSLLEKKTLISDIAKPKKGKMHKILDIPEDKDISDIYTSGKKLAQDLVKKVGKKKATGMIAFAANINSDNNIFDKALRALDQINENVETEVSIKLEDVKRLSNNILNLLNTQIKNELQSSQIYRGMSAQADDNGQIGASKYYFKTGGEELVHMDKIYKFIFDRNASVIVPATESVKQNFTDIKEVVTESLNHEMLVTKQQENISQTAKQEGDNTTYHFAQQFLSEQIEEEAKFRDILFKINLNMPNQKIDELFESL